jgi:hypothetical protein
MHTPTLSLISTLTLAAAALGCGGSDPGVGTRTLFVTAEAFSNGSSDGTGLRVGVREGSSSGRVLSGNDGAVVTVRGNQSGERTLSFSGVSWGNWTAGLFVASQMPWDTGWHLRVQRGSDELEAYLEAPGPTTVMEPLGNTVYHRAAGKPLVIRWKDEGRRAERVRIDFDRANFDQTLAEDPLRFEVEPNRLVPEQERVRVSRIKQIDLAGGVAGSTFTATTWHRIEFVVE